MKGTIVSRTTGHAVGKIIAVHLSYPSRAAQRGRIPSDASYFIKAPSSIADPGTVERPANTELLVFEGEIALVIGTAARRVTEDGAALDGSPPATTWAYSTCAPPTAVPTPAPSPAMA